MNSVFLKGRLTRDAEIRTTNSDKPTTVARFTLAVDRQRTSGQESQADFISCVAFGKVAETIQNYTHQGSNLIVEGRIQTGNYTKQDGTRVYTTDVVVERIEFLDKKNSGSNSGQNQGQSQQQMPWQSQAPAPAQQAAPAQQPQQGWSQPAQQPQQQTWNQQQPQQQSWGQAAADGFMQIPPEDEGLPFR